MRTSFLIAAIALALSAAACSGGSSEPKATATPTKPGAVDAIAQWVRDNRNVGFLPDCTKAVRGEDTGKLCTTLKGERGTRRAYDLGPTFSNPTALALVEEQADAWVIVSVTNRDPSAGDIPGIPWPLQVGDAVLVVGLDEPDCLRIREQPTQAGAQLNCVPTGTQAIIQEGPIDADTYTWWRVAGEGFNGWAAGTWLRLEDAIADALNPNEAPADAATATPASD